MHSLLSSNVVPEAPHNELLCPQLRCHSTPEKPLYDSCSVLNYECEYAFLVKIPRKEGIEPVIDWELADIEEYLGKDL